MIIHDNNKTGQERQQQSIPIKKVKNFHFFGKNLGQNRSKRRTTIWRGGEVFLRTGISEQNLGNLAQGGNLFHCAHLNGLFGHAKYDTGCLILGHRM